METVFDRVIALQKEHPDLPVIPIIHRDVVAGNYPLYWAGHISGAEIQRYMILENSFHLYKESNLREVEAVLEVCNGPEVLYDSPEALLEQYRKLPWEEAIFLSIDPPDDDG